MEENSNDMFTDHDIDWFMGLENNQNQLLRRTPATNGRPEHWEIKRGNYITLGKVLPLWCGLALMLRPLPNVSYLPCVHFEKTPQQVEYGPCTVYQECKALEEH